MTIQTITEFYPDQIVDLGGAWEISFHMNVRLDTGETEWHYYGTAMPEPPPAGTVVEHAAAHLPLLITDMTDSQGLMYDLAAQWARQVLNA